jgi:hypothetical protein
VEVDLVAKRALHLRHQAVVAVVEGRILFATLPLYC